MCWKKKEPDYYINGLGLSIFYLSTTNTHTHTHNEVFGASVWSVIKRVQDRIVGTGTARQADSHQQQ